MLIGTASGHRPSPGYGAQFRRVARGLLREREREIIRLTIQLRELTATYEARGGARAMISALTPSATVPQAALAARPHLALVMGH